MKILKIILFNTCPEKLSLFDYFFFFLLKKQ